MIKIGKPQNFPKKSPKKNPKILLPSFADGGGGGGVRLSRTRGVLPIFSMTGVLAYLSLAMPAYNSNI